MKKKIAAVIALVLLICITATGCTEANQVSYNISKEADNFNVTRKLTVLNARTDTILLELTGTFALKNNNANELEVIIETAENKYQKDYVYLNDYTKQAWKSINRIQYTICPPTVFSSGISFPDGREPERTRQMVYRLASGRQRS